MPRVSIMEQDKVFQIASGEVLYDSLKSQGKELPHGCLSGSCGACKIEIIEGEGNLSQPGIIELDTIDSLKKEFPMAKNIRLSCRAKVLGDIKFSVLK